MRTRVIPCLLLRDGRLVKTTRFRQPTYVGDPINAMRIFNDKEVDELFVLDIAATPAGRGPDFEAAKDIVEEAFMPIGFGGGITSTDDAARLFDTGVEKVVVGTAGVMRPALVSQLSARYGAQAIVAAIDVKSRMLGGWQVATSSGANATGQDPVVLARQMTEAGAGEILLTAIDRDGTRQGYDLKLVAAVAGTVGVPVVACGGARSIDDFAAAVSAGASAVAAGSFFVHHGPHRAVLISYPARSWLLERLP